MTAVFLSHRRPDGSAHARRLAQELGVPGGGIEVVPGLESLAPGTDIVDAIEGIVDRADVVLAVIGPDWLSDTDQHGRRRIDLATDTVRIELATALRRPGPVIPVLVGGAIMPQPDELPVDVSALARRTPVELRDASWAADVERLRATLVPLGPPADGGDGDGSRNRLMMAVIAVLVLLVAGLAVAGFMASGDDDDAGSTSVASTTTDAATSEAEETTTEAAASTAEEPTTEQATTEPPPATTATTGPDLSAVLFEDALTPPSDVFTSGPGDDGCTSTAGQDGYQLAVAAATVCSATGFLDADELPDSALSVTAALPAGAPAPADGDDVHVALSCAATDSSDYLATIGPDGAFELLRRTDVTGAPRGTRLASGAADGVSLADGALRLRMTCTTSDAGVRVQVAVDDESIISAIDPDPLPAGVPTFGVSRTGDGEFAAVFTGLVVNGPPG